MAVIDFKNATVFMRDGYSLAGAVNHPSGYSLGDTTIAVDGFTGAIETGDKFLITGDTTVYTITAHTETLSNTTSVTFTPALAADVLDNAVVTFYEANADTGAVDNGAGYAAAATTMTMDSFVGALENGDKFTIATQTQVYTITAHTETLGNTTSITFTPGLTDAVVDTQVLTFYEVNADTALVNNAVTGYVAGRTTISVDGFTAAVAVGDYFTLEGDTARPRTQYQVTAKTDVLGATKSITFTPAIPTGQTVADNAVVTVGPHQVEVNLGDGNLTYSEKKNRDYKLNRGVIDTVRDGDEAPMEVSLDSMWEWTKGADDDPPTPEDVVKKRGNASTWESSSSDPCEPFCVDLLFRYVPDCSSVAYEEILLPEFRYESIDHDPKAGTISFKGKCNALEAISTRYE